MLLWFLLFQVAAHNFWLGKKVDGAVDALRVHHQLEPDDILYEPTFPQVISLRRLWDLNFLYTILDDSETVLIKGGHKNFFQELLKNFLEIITEWLAFYCLHNLFLLHAY